MGALENRLWGRRYKGLVGLPQFLVLEPLNHILLDTHIEDLLFLSFSPIYFSFHLRLCSSIFAIITSIVY